MILRLILATLVLHLVLVLPNYPAALTWNFFTRLPLELPVVICAMLAFGGTRFGTGIRAALTLLLTALFALKTADIVSFDALSRAFNPVSDLALIEAFVRLIYGALGGALTVLVLIGAVLALVLTALALWWAMGQWARVQPPRKPLFAGAVALFAGLVVAEVGHWTSAWKLPQDIPGTAITTRIGVKRAALVGDTLTELAEFRTAMAQDDYRGRTDLLDRIDRDVIVVFVESYGRTSHDTPFYADIHRPTLERYQAQLEGQGLAMRSGFLSAPTKGGQSWLSHATVANGLWIDNQVSYAAILASGRDTLFHHAARAGFHTAAVMPQITLDWPEAASMGFETVLPAAALGYKGLPFNWVTMPDQFTFAAIDRLLRDPEVRDDRPVFVQIATGTSHAPWVPIPDIIAWEDLGDGTVFNEVASSGDTPKVVWRDRERVREQYRKAVDYALATVFEYAALHADNPPLMIVIGDHQAAEFVALDDRPDVPIHVIGPAPLVDALAPVAPTGGLLPADDVDVIPMDALRDIALNVYSTISDDGTPE